MHQKLTLPILLGLSLSGCQDANVGGAKVSQKLNAIGDITVEIQQAHEIAGHPYYRIAEDSGQIELLVSDPALNHQSIATEISKLKSVQSFDGSLVVVFRHPEDESVVPTMWIKYDAKTGRQVEQ